MKKLFRNGLWVGLCIIGVLVGLAINTVGDLRDWLASDRWVTTSSTKVTFNHKISRVNYTYLVAGQTYTGQRTHFFMKAPHDDERHLAWLNTHRRTTTVTVYYNSEVPERAVLVREVPFSWFIQFPIILSYVCLVILFPLLVFGSLWWWLRGQFVQTRSR